MKYELEYNEFSVDLVEYKKGSIFQRRTILTIRIDREDDPKEEIEQKLSDLKMIAEALNRTSNEQTADSSNND